MIRSFHQRKPTLCSPYKTVTEIPPSKLFDLNSTNDLHNNSSSLLVSSKHNSISTHTTQLLGGISFIDLSELKSNLYNFSGFSRRHYSLFSTLILLVAFFGKVGAESQLEDQVKTHLGKQLDLQKDSFVSSPPIQHVQSVKITSTESLSQSTPSQSTHVVSAKKLHVANSLIPIKEDKRNETEFQKSQNSTEKHKKEAGDQIEPSTNLTTSSAISTTQKTTINPKLEEEDDSKVIPALTLEEFQEKEKQKSDSPSKTTQAQTTTSKSTKAPSITTKSSNSSESENSRIVSDHEKKLETSTSGVNGTGNESMLVIEKSAIDLIPLEGLISAMLTALAATFMVVGGAIPYIFQYSEIHKRKSALGFSLLVCLALCVANILRINFWFGKRFETVLLVQSVVMIACMLLMLEISVRMNRKMTPPSQRTSVWKGDIVSSFWKWNDFSSFIAALLAFTAVAGLITYFCTQFPIYVEGLGMVSLLVEACLGLPQLIQNFQRKSTQGMSIKMIMAWFLGDVGKTTYFIVRKTPAQFWICGSLQITIDVLILLQVYFYNRGNSRIPNYIPSKQTKADT